MSCLRKLGERDAAQGRDEEETSSNLGHTEGCRLEQAIAEQGKQ